MAQPRTLEELAQETRVIVHDPRAKEPAMNLLSAGPSPDARDAAVATMILGLTSALRAKTITIRQSEERLFNLDVLLAAERAGVRRAVYDAIADGMQLDDLDWVVPGDDDALYEAYDRIDALCRAVLADAQPPAAAA